jgi:hypothetical protein
MIGDDFIMPLIDRLEVKMNEEINEIRFIPDEAVRNRLIEENERMNRADQRYNEDIERDNLMVNVETNISMIIESDTEIEGWRWILMVPW